MWDVGCGVLGVGCRVSMVTAQGEGCRVNPGSVVRQHAANPRECVNSQGNSQPFLKA